MSRTFDLQTNPRNATSSLFITNDAGSTRQVRATNLEHLRGIEALDEQPGDLFILNGFAGVEKADLIAELTSLTARA